jgi:hypothetical protein
MLPPFRLHCHFYVGHRDRINAAADAIVSGERLRWQQSTTRERIPGDCSHFRPAFERDTRIWRMLHKTMRREQDPGQPRPASLSHQSRNIFAWIAHALCRENVAARAHGREARLISAVLRDGCRSWKVSRSATVRQQKPSHRALHPGAGWCDSAITVCSRQMRTAPTLPLSISARLLRCSLAS